MKKILLLACVLITVGTMAQNDKPNTLSSQEKKDGWKLLFDGKSTKGWRNYNSDKIGEAWKVVDGTLTLDLSDKSKKGGDIVTADEYENYEFALEWKISKCGNSGIFFNVVESDKYKEGYRTGPEMQVLDNECHPDAKIVKHRAGDLYDLITSSKETVRPAGEWNQVRIVSNKAHYQFYLNGTMIVEFDMHTPQWDAMVAGSKFKDMPDFGKATKGRLSLQDHGDQVWYRNIKIKNIK